MRPNNSPRRFVLAATMALLAEVMLLLTVLAFKSAQPAVAPRTAAFGAPRFAQDSGYSAAKHRLRNVRDRALTAYQSSPDYFEPLPAASPGFLIRLAGASAILRSSQVLFRFRPRASSWRLRNVPAESVPKLVTASRQPDSASLRLRFVGGNSRAPGQGSELLPGKTNYLLGSDPRHWRRNVPHFGQVRYPGIYPGVDLLFHRGLRDDGLDGSFIEQRARSEHGRAHRGDSPASKSQDMSEREHAQSGTGGVEFDLAVAPGADPRRIILQLNGAESTSLTPSGDLVLHVEGREVTLHRPRAYQTGVARNADATLGGPSRRVRVAYKLSCKLAPDARDRTILLRFALGPYDHTQALIIDPSISISYSSFLGGTGSDTANSVVLDPSGAVYVAGSTTQAAGFPETSQAIGSGGEDDIFIAKLDPSVSGAASLVYLTFIGGSGQDDGGLLAFDSSSNSLGFVAVTSSSDFPVTDKSKRHAGPNDLVVGKLDPSGSRLVFATYFGGNGSEMTQGHAGIAADGAGSLYIASDTSSSDLPVTRGAYGAKFGGGASDGFLAKFAASGALAYCSYLGVNAQVGVSGIVTDTNANVYLTGFTSMPANPFPATNGFQSSYAGGSFDAFVMKFEAAGQGANDLLYSTLLGGSGADQALAIALDAASPPAVYVTGTTQSTDFPASSTVAPLQAALNGSSDAFLAVISQKPSGATALAYSTYLGGSADDSGLGVSVLSPNKVLVAGNTSSPDFPVQNALQGFTGTSDGFLAALNPASSGASGLVYSTYLGGSASTQMNAVAADSANHIFLAGNTASTDYPAAGSPNNGFQLLCTSCGAATPLPDAVITELLESDAPVATVAFTPAGLNFGSQLSGSLAPPQNLILMNNGDAALFVSAISISGLNSADFSQTNDCPISPSSIAPASGCTITATFAPSSATHESAAVSVSDNVPGSPHLASLRGYGIEPIAALSPSSLDFGSQPAGTTSNAQTLTISNSGDAALELSGPSISGQDAAQFTFTQDSCSGMLNPGENCAINLVFVPAALGTFLAQVNVSDNSGNISGNLQTIPLSGIGTPPAPVASYSANALAFGTQPVGTITAAQTVTLRNTGSANLLISSIALTGANAAEFLLSSSAGVCPTGVTPLAPGNSCAISVEFAPQSAGAKSASVAIADNAGSGSQMIVLTGTGSAPAASAIPMNLEFSSQNVGSTSPAQPVTLSNTGSAPLSISGIAITGAAAGSFRESNNCPGTLAANANCVIQVSFQPQITGNLAACLSITDNAGGSPQLVALSGVATAPAVALAPAALNFSTQLVGTAASPAAVTVSNMGTGSLSISTISFGAVNAGDFSETDNCTAAAIAVNASCTVNVTFKPVSAGPRMATLNLADNAPESPQMAPLAGSASDFSISSANGVTSATISPGQSASYSLQVNSINGFSGTVSLACSSGAPVSNCMASPSMLNVGAGTVSPFMVSVGTVAALAPRAGLQIPFDSAPLPARRPVAQSLLLGVLKEGRLGFALTVLLMTALILILALRLSVSFHGWRGAARRALAVVTATAGLAIILQLQGCSGGANGASGPSGGAAGTIAGTYTVSVTATTQGVTRTLSLTLTVQ